MHQNQSQPKGLWQPYVKSVLLLAVIVATFLMVWSLKNVLLPLFFAAVLAYLLDPMVRFLEHRKIKRSVGSAILVTLAIVLAVFMFLIPLPILISQLNSLNEKLPEMIIRLREVISGLPWIDQYIPEKTELYSNMQTFVTENVSVSKVSQQALTYIKQGSSVILTLLSWLVLMPVLTYYLLSNWPETTKLWKSLIPLRWRNDFAEVVSRIDVVLGQYIRGQTLVMIVLALYYSIALSFTGLDVAISVGVLTGLFVIIPFLGFGIGMVLGVLSALLQFGVGYNFYLVVGVYLVGQILESYLLTPYLVGEKIGLSPVTVIASLMAFGTLFGFVGVLFALPASAIVAVLAKFMTEKYQNSDFYLSRT